MNLVFGDLFHQVDVFQEGLLAQDILSLKCRGLDNHLGDN